MIKVNLLKTKIIENPGTGIAIENSASDTGAMRSAILKVLMILVFTLGLMLYENQTIRALNQETASMITKVTQMQAAVNAKAVELEGFKDVEARAKELEDKLKILKSLSNLRLREVKTLDFMQSSIPEQVWLRNVVYESDRERVEEGRFVFVGRAVTTDDLSEFVKRLDESAYLDEVIVIRNQEIPDEGNQSNRDFQMTAQVETPR